MAKKRKVSYMLSPTAVGGDLYLDKKYALNNELSQDDLKKIYDSGHLNVVFKIEG